MFKLLWDGRRIVLWQGLGLLAASACLLVTCLLWAVAVLLDVLGPMGGVDAGGVARAAMVLDLPGVLLLALLYRGLALRAQGRTRLLRHGVAMSFLAWAGLSAFWRFALPAIAGSNAQALFMGVLGACASCLPASRDTSAVVAEILGLWIAAAALFVVAHVLILWDYRRADATDWVRGLPAYAWLVGAVVSLIGTVGIVAGVLPVLGGGVPDGAFTSGAILKLLVAPNIFLSSYVGSLQLGRAVVSMGRPGANPAA